MNGRRRQRGFSAIMALMLVVVLATLTATMVTSGGVQHASTALSWYASQSWYAANSGMEWAINRALASQAAHDAVCSSPATTTNFSITLSGQVFDLAVVCDDRRVAGFSEAGVGYEIDHVTVTASHASPGDLDYVSRTIEATVTRGSALP